ncbi:A/G-specific adenine glycosylase [Stieleria varia]|uniref:Adenine DNA glycosylase n=1 Tax=Stieleria varia TaxID=2528005 RepID=A0A5C6A7X8_9BACT|nr:A/G-specific adenine glycosylase [Stieleria varia]TWT94403.1 A/G-specific adenine glycosylase [Stieleria varia]
MTRVGQPDHDPIWSDSRWRSRIRKRLLDWFQDNARELPWRSDPTPYHVWISEIMLQQTQVATVLPYYQRFMKSFPTVQSLAAADESELMKHWEGLGYYRRARSMHAAAKVIMEQYDGEFPLQFDQVLALPGIGRYTAGAILSISSGQRLPILEGNTHRVYSRWIALREPPMEKAANALLWQFAESILPRKSDAHGSGQFNQAAMELGALVCLPKNPKCDACPVRRDCRAAASGLQDQIPGKMTKTRYEDRTEFALILAQAPSRTSSAKMNSTHLAKYLLRPLPTDGRWGGLWDFPRPTHGDLESVIAAAQWLSDEIGHPVDSGVCLKTIKHAVTKYRITLHVHMAQARLMKGWRPPAPWQWMTVNEMLDLPMSVTGRKIVEFLNQTDQMFLPLE